MGVWVAGSPGPCSSPLYFHRAHRWTDVFAFPCYRVPRLLHTGCTRCAILHTSIAMVISSPPQYSQQCTLSQGHLLLFQRLIARVVSNKLLALPPCPGYIQVMGQVGSGGMGTRQVSDADGKGAVVT